MGSCIVLSCIVVTLILFILDDMKGEFAMPYLPQKVYEILRWVIIIVIPALITLYGVIGNVCNIPYTDIVLTIAGAVDVCLGTIFGISKLNYDRENKQ